MCDTLFTHSFWFSVVVRANNVQDLCLMRHADSSKASSLVMARVLVCCYNLNMVGVAIMQCRLLVNGMLMSLQRSFGQV